MILDSVQLKTKYLELFPMINRKQFWLSAPKHSSVCTQWDRSLPCLREGNPGSLGSDSQRDGDCKRYSIINVSIFSLCSPLKVKSLTAFYVSLSLQTSKGDFEPVREISGHFYASCVVKGISLGWADLEKLHLYSKESKREDVIKWVRWWRFQRPNRMCLCKNFCRMRI